MTTALVQIALLILMLPVAFLIVRAELRGEGVFRWGDLPSDAGDGLTALDSLESSASDERSL